MVFFRFESAISATVGGIHVLKEGSLKYRCRIRGFFSIDLLDGDFYSLRRSLIFSISVGEGFYFGRISSNENWFGGSKFWNRKYSV